MKPVQISRILTLTLVTTLTCFVSIQSLAQSNRSIQTEADFDRAMEELSNWGRWGDDDELGAANLITDQKRKDAVALVTEGITVSLAHNVNEVDAADATGSLKRTVLSVRPTGASDQYQYTGTYHGTIHSHLDAVGCHIMYKGKGYNGVPWEEVEAANGCPKSSIIVHKNGILTRGILFDATLLPGKATAQGWLEPGTAITYDDLVELERIEGIRVEPGDVILLYTGRWKRREALGPWSPRDVGVAGFHANVAYFMKERGVSFIGHDLWNDVTPSGVENVFLPLHSLALASMGVAIFDNLDLGLAAETARRLNRYEFMFTAAPLRIDMGMGSPINPIATF